MLSNKSEYDSYSNSYKTRISQFRRIWEGNKIKKNVLFPEPGCCCQQKINLLTIIVDTKFVKANIFIFLYWIAMVLPLW